MSDDDMTIREMHDSLAALMLAAGPSDAADADPDVAEDSEWTCDRCGARIGVVDVRDGTIRRKYKDDMTFTQLGPGGKITHPCRRCAHPNAITHDDIRAIQKALGG